MAVSSLGKIQLNWEAEDWTAHQNRQGVVTESMAWQRAKSMSVSWNVPMAELDNTGKGAGLTAETVAIAEASCRRHGTAAAAVNVQLLCHLCCNNNRDICFASCSGSNSSSCTSTSTSRWRCSCSRLR